MTASIFNTLICKEFPPLLSASLPWSHFVLHHHHQTPLTMLNIRFSQTPTSPQHLPHCRSQKRKHMTAAVKEVSQFMAREKLEKQCLLMSKKLLSQLFSYSMYPSSCCFLILSWFLDMHICIYSPNLFSVLSNFAFWDIYNESREVFPRKRQYWIFHSNKYELNVT